MSFNYIDNFKINTKRINKRCFFVYLLMQLLMIFLVIIPAGCSDDLVQNNQDGPVFSKTPPIKNNNNNNYNHKRQVKRTSMDLSQQSSSSALESFDLSDQASDMSLARDTDAAGNNAQKSSLLIDTNNSVMGFEDNLLDLPSSDFVLANQDQFVTEFTEDNLSEPDNNALSDDHDYDSQNLQIDSIRESIAKGDVTVTEPELFERIKTLPVLELENDEISENNLDESDEVSVQLFFSNVKSAYGGNLCLAIYDNQETFLTEDSVFGSCQSVKNQLWKINLPNDRRLAFSVLHDKDLNGKLTTKIFGIPAEGIGFSNNPLIMTGPPSFHDTALKLYDEITVNIKLKYFL